MDPKNNTQRAVPRHTRYGAAPNNIRCRP